MYGMAVSKVAWVVCWGEPPLLVLPVKAVPESMFCSWQSKTEIQYNNVQAHQPTEQPQPLVVPIVVFQVVCF